jgi:hypothetical protein
LKNCKTFLEVLGLDIEVSRLNFSRQSAVECGFFVMHWLEEFMRAYDGQGKASLGWPEQRISSVKTLAKSYMQTLEAVRQKWLVQRQKEDEEEALRAQAMHAAALQYIAKNGLSEDLKAAQAELAATLLSIGEGPKPIPLPEGFGVKAKLEKKKELEAKLEDKKELDSIEKAVAEEFEKKELEVVEVKLEEKKDVAAIEKAAAEELEKKELEVVEAKLEEKKDVAAIEKAAAEELEKKEVEVVEAKLEEGKAAEVVEVKSASSSAPLKKESALKGKKVKQLSQQEEMEVQFCIEHWKIEDLSLERRQAYERVRDNGIGICSSCRWTSGCLRCDPSKAWNYYVRQELGLSGSHAKKGKKAEK